MVAITPQNLLLGATSLLSHLSLTAAQASIIAPAGILYRWSVLPSTTSSPDLFLQIDAPTDLQWVALGTGHRMRNSNIFMIYTDGAGNVTLSTRTSNGHTGTFFSDERQEDVELLAGSGINNERMTANILCRDGCGGLDLTGTDKWIAGWRDGEAFDTTDLDAPANMHLDARVYEVDYDVATVAEFDLAEPFAGTDAFTNRGVISVNDPKPVIHAVLMSVAFLILYPIGAIIMPLFGRWQLHAVWQLVAFLVMWAGFAIGYISANENEFYFDEAHTRFGTIIAALLVVQPILGWLHHAYFQKHRARGVVSYAHIWYGRTLLLLGAINGGLGLRLVGEAPDGPLLIVYCVLAGVFGSAYIGSIVWKQVKKRKTVPREKTSPNMSSGSPEMGTPF